MLHLYRCHIVTASHNPAKYNGYNAYGLDGCEITDDAAAIVYEEIQKKDVLTVVNYIFSDYGKIFSCRWE